MKPDVDYPVDALKNIPGLISLTAQYNAAREVLLAARTIGDPLLQQATRRIVNYLKWFPVETCTEKVVQLPLSGNDVCQTIIYELGEIDNFILSTDEPVLAWRGNWHRKKADEIEEPMRDDLKDPDYVSGEYEGESSS